MHIVASANDVGCALQIKSLLEDGGTDCPVDFTVFASKQAHFVFHGIAKKQVVVHKMDHHTKIVLDSRPDFALVGMSSYQDSIDPVLSKYATDVEIPMGSIQDFWGSYAGFNVVPNSHFFVWDDLSAKMLSESLPPSCTVHVTGSPKHEKYRHLDYPKIAVSDTAPILFCGQAGEIAGYHENVGAFAEVLARSGLKQEIWFKPHPDSLHAIPSPELSVLATTIPPEEPIEPLLHQARLVVTCFSTAAIDHHFMQAFSPHTLGQVLYLNMGKSLQNHMQKDFGFPTLSSLTQGMGLVCDRFEDLSECLQEGQCAESIATYRQAAQARFAHEMPASKRLLGCIESIAESHHLGKL